MKIEKRKRIRVKNRCGDNYSGSDFLAHWKEVKGQSAPVCARIGCNREATCGGHVYQPGTGPHPHYYIVPLCASCNNTAFTDDYEVYEDEMVDAQHQN